jgi:DNA-directed RNA polymerase specialized sigma24 family protein
MGSWLARIAHSTAIDTTRRTSRRRHLMRSELPDLDAWAVGGTVDEEVVWRLARARQSLRVRLESE